MIPLVRKEVTFSFCHVSKEFSKLKYSVPDFIQNNNELKRLIVSISDADRIDGGEGAILIRLKNLQNEFW